MKTFKSVEDIPEGFMGECQLGDKNFIYCFVQGFIHSDIRRYVVEFGFIQSVTTNQRTWYCNGVSSDEETVMSHPAATAYRLKRILSDEIL